MFQFINDGSFSRTGTSSDDNLFSVQIGKILAAKFGIKFFNKKCKVTRCAFRLIFPIFHSLKREFST